MQRCAMTKQGGCYETDSAGCSCGYGGFGRRRRPYIGSASGQSNGDAAPIYGVKIPDGYRDWRLISVKRLTGKQLTGAGGELKQLRAELGNDVAIKAYRDGTLPFPDG